MLFATSAEFISKIHEGCYLPNSEEVKNFLEKYKP